MRFRDQQERYKSSKGRKLRKVSPNNVVIDHNYESSGTICNGVGCTSEDCSIHRGEQGKRVNDSWKEGRRLVELGLLLNNLKYCQSCKLGPVPLTYLSVVGELQKGLGGYLYVTCQNIDCGHVNTVPYGKTHRDKQKGMPCFVANTKLGTAMVDSLGGPVRVNNFLSTLNMKSIPNKNLKAMEERAGEVMIAHSAESTRNAAEDAFKKEMEDIAAEESFEAQHEMVDLIEDLGVCPLPDASPSVRLKLQAGSVEKNDSEWSDYDDDNDDDDEVQTETGNTLNSPSQQSVSLPFSVSSYSTPVSDRQPWKKHGNHHRSSMQRPSSSRNKVKQNLAPKYPCRKRSGMSCAVDTAWHKRGFDSLTSHTFFMSKAKYGKKVVKTVVCHRACGTCNWWRRNRPGQNVKKHKCVRNHTGSARLMESVSGVRGVQDLAQGGTPVEYLEGDGDNTMLARLKSELNLNMKKRFDRNHIVKNVGKNLYKLHHEKGVKISKNVVIHIEKCLKYALAKNQGDKDALEDNLKALIPHQFGDHTLCKGQFCGYRRKQGETYQHRSLPYKTSLKDPELRKRLDSIFQPLIVNSSQFVDLGSSQQCEHANREVTLRAPKSHHYGNSKSLDYRVHATASFINDGRHYISKVNSKAGLSPGAHTVKYAEKCMKRRMFQQEKSKLPSTKRRRLVLKQERCTNQGAQEALEGISYQSGIGHEEEVDVEKLPDAVPRGNFKPTVLSGEATVITVDLETTDLISYGQMPHITQIAATNVQTGAAFDVYVTPKRPISLDAQKVTGIAMIGNNTMTVNGTEVVHLGIHSAIDKFCVWLEKCPNVVLVAHNGRRFDYPVLMSALTDTKSTERFFKCVSSFVDSLPVFKKLYPNQSHRQEDLAAALLGITYNAHNALADVETLGKLLNSTKLSDKELLKYSFSPLAVYNSRLFNLQKSKNIKSLEVLVSRGACKMPTAENIAGSGLNLTHLRKIYERAGEDGLRDTFVIKNSEGLPRVTNVKRILDDVIPKIAAFFKQ